MLSRTASVLSLSFALSVSSIAGCAADPTGIDSDPAESVEAAQVGVPAWRTPFAGHARWTTTAWKATLAGGSLTCTVRPDVSRITCGPASYSQRVGGEIANDGTFDIRTSSPNETGELKGAIQRDGSLAIVKYRDTQCEGARCSTTESVRITVRTAPLVATCTLPGTPFPSAYPGGTTGASDIACAECRGRCLPER